MYSSWLGQFPFISHYIKISSFMQLFCHSLFAPSTFYLTYSIWQYSTHVLMGANMLCQQQWQTETEREWAQGKKQRKTNKLSINSSKTNKEENVHAKCETTTQNGQQQRNWLCGRIDIEWDRMRKTSSVHDTGQHNSTSGSKVGHLTRGVKLCVKSCHTAHKPHFVCVCVLEILQAWATRSGILRPF